MFTVKATYRGEIRKISFNDLTFFPSFDQLHNQLYRVFPSSHNYFLSKLLFCPDASQASRILIAREVHSADDYAKCLAPYLGRTWPNALLRVSVFDETPHKAPVAPLNTTSMPSGSPWSIHGSASSAGSLPLSAEGSQQPYFNKPISLFHIPPPPIIFSAPPRAVTQAPMEVDSLSTSYRTQQTPQQSHTSPQYNPFAPKDADCCSVAQGQSDIQSLLTDFQRDLDSILTRTFGGAAARDLQMNIKFGNSSSSSSTGPNRFSSQPQPQNCSSCSVPLLGNWRTCRDCGDDLCIGCCYALGPCSKSHAGHRLIPQFPSTWGAPPPPPPRWALDSSTSQGLSSFSTLPRPIWGTYIPPIPVTQAPIPPLAPFVPPSPFWAPSPSLPPPPPIISAVTPPPPPPVIHQGIICDMCNMTIEGIRHKCLDCPDYDLCTSCIGSGLAERHNPFHEFFEITEPGRVVVHTVFSGDGSAAEPNRRPAPEPALILVDPPVHHATCDLCDSRIQGNRYKCAMCPDFDTCGSCFGITSEQHPGHSFVKLANPDDYIRRDNSPGTQHFAACNACNKPIFGVRYKCMHPQCPDFDLCEGCEAHPIPVHPENHPMLKMKSNETAVPTLHRAPSPEQIERVDCTRGRCRIPMIYSPESSRCRSSSHSCSPPRSLHHASSQEQAERLDSPIISSRSLERGYMSNPSKHKGRDQSFLPAHTPPFPPFFGTVQPEPASPRVKREPSTPPYLPPLNLSRSRSRSRSRSTSRSPSPLWRPTPPIPASPTRWSAPVDYSLYSRDPMSTAVPTSFPRMTNANHASDEWRPLFEYLNPGQGNQPSNHPGSAPSNLPIFPTPPRIPTPVSAAVYRSPWIASQSLDHLMHESPSFISQTEPRYGPAQVTSIGDVPIVPSPLNNEALLIRPTLADLLNDGEIMSLASNNRSLAALLSGYHSSPEPLSQTKDTDNTEDIEHPKEIEQPKEEDVVEIHQEPLTADFIADITVPDGQMFPPGAEFMKCWRMINDSKQDWPESTELVFVAGVPLAKENLPQSVTVGVVKAGAEVDLWTGELKAPDFPGRYVGYWRLRDDKGQLFGNSIWVDINVAESNQASDESMTSSSIIIMPDAAAANSRAVSVQDSQDQPTMTSTTAGFRSPVLSSFSKPSTDAAQSDDGMSDDSSVSLISMPSSEDMDDAVWEDSRSQVTVEQVSQAMEYVLLYDDNTSSDED